MRLVFVHGWAFDKDFWNPVGDVLSDIPSIKIELGFLGAAQEIPPFTPEDILVGHSLGFLWGIDHYRQWKSWIAITAFARFAGALEEGACVPAAVLRAMKNNLMRDTRATVDAFYKNLGHGKKCAVLNEARLKEGLDWLQNKDVRDILRQIDGNGLILAGGQDPLVPRMTIEFLAARQETKIEWQQEAGHLLPLTNPVWCAEKIRNFIA